MAMVTNWLADIITNIWELFFPRKGHIQVPTVSGSEEWSQPDIVNVSQDWLKYLSLPFRTQWAGAFDEDNCATRAAIETLEAILNYYLMNNQFPDFIANFLKKYYCNSAGYIKLSIRFNSKLNNTTVKGANVTDVWNNFNRDGVVPESVYPDPIGRFTWDEYYQDIPNGIEQYGEMTTKFFKVIWKIIWNSNWNVPDIAELREALKSSPVYFASAVGTRDSSGIEQWNHDKIYKHARLLFNESTTQDILDSYEYPEYLRKLSQSFPLACAIQGAIKII